MTGCNDGMTMTDTEASADLSPVLIQIFRGVLYRDQHEALWQQLLTLQNRVRDHVQVLSLELVLDEPQGYAYLRQAAVEDEEKAPPRLVPRRQLSYPVSLLLVLLRKKLIEHDAGSGDPRLILTQEEIVELIRLFLPDTANEAKLVDRIQTDINKVIELGFMRRLRGQSGRYEVRRILQSFVDAQWLGEFEQRLAEYREQSREQ